MNDVSKQPMICIVGPCLKMGGMERASANLANSLQALGAATQYVAVFQHERFFTLHPDIVFREPQGFNCHSLSFLKTIRYLRHTIRELKPQSVLAFNKFYAALTLLATMGLGIPVFISERSSPLFQWGKKLDFFHALVYRLREPRGIMAQTQIAASYQQQYYGKSIPIKVIPNAVRPIVRFPEIKREKTVLAVGRFNDHLKGFDRLIEAFAMISAPEWRLVFAGGDENGAELKSLASKCNISDRVDYLGRIRDLDPVYAAASIFVIPSRSEGFPNALCEAMAAGLPCIAFDFIAGPRDLIQHDRNGILVSDGDILGLAQAIESLIVNPEKRRQLGKEAENIAERLKGEDIAQETLKFILS